MGKNDPIQYDEDDAVKFIQNRLPQEAKNKYSNDEINYVIDIIYDFYEEKGVMNMDDEDESSVEIDEDEMITYVMKSIKKDKFKHFEEEDIIFIIQGELAYCESIGIFED